MPSETSDGRPRLINLVVESSQEGMKPDQVLRRIGLYGYTEGDLLAVTEEFMGHIDRIRRYFKDSGHAFKADGKIEAAGVRGAIRAEQGDRPLAMPDAT